MIVMKFGGTSVADAERILGVCEIVREHGGRQPVLVVSALAGITDLLEQAVAIASRGEREALEPILAEIERRHRWAVAGAIEPGAARHDLDLSVDALFEDLRQLLRSVRILGESTGRARDALLSFGEALSTRIVTAALRARGLAPRWVDAREILVTDARHGAATPDPAAVRERCARVLRPLLADGRIPVVGGFVGADRAGVTTTLGRGGSDTSAAVIGAALGAEEIQIWTDVNGLMSADPRLVPEARTLPRVTFDEAAELAHWGARVLHPASIEPAVRCRIPVRVRNTLDPAGRGTVILDEPARDASPVVAVASRAGVRAVRIRGERRHRDAGFPAHVLRLVERAGLAPELVVASEIAVTLVVPGTAELGPLAAALGADLRLESSGPCGVLCVVGKGLGQEGRLREEVLAALGALDPEVVALGESSGSVTAVVDERRLETGVGRLHRRFFEQEARRP